MTMTNNKSTNTPQEDEYEEVRSNWVKFNKVDDYIAGTLIDIFVPETPDQYGKKNRTYILLATEGSFHGSDESKVIDDQPTVIEPGEIYRVGSKPAIDGQMTKMEIGDKVKFKLIEIRPTKKGNPAKIVKVYRGRKNLEWLKSNSSKNQADTEFDQM